MDNITHSLVGALIGQAGLKRKTGLAMPALIIGANLPDVDAACLFWLDGVEHLGFRRGITHGPIAWAVLPLILAGLLWGFDRWQAKRGTRPEGRLPVSRSEEHTSELQPLMRISYAVFCLKKKIKN